MSSENHDVPETLTLRPIPDGGLKRAMPEWLKRPPSWRDAAPESPLSEESVSAARVIPAAETAVIDPRTLVAVDDLPEWLQLLATREMPAAITDYSTTAEAAMDEETTMPDEKFSRTALESEPMESRSVPLESTNKKITDVQDGKVEKYGGGKPNGFQPTLPMMLIALVVAGLLIWALLSLF